MTKVFDTIERAFGYYTECNLDTLEILQERSRSSKSDIYRQQSICDEMVFACRQFNVKPSAVYSSNSTPRLNDLLKERGE